MNILIPTDFSESAFHAVHYTYEHFDLTHTRIIIVHAIVPPISSTANHLFALDLATQKQAEKKMRQLLLRIKKKFKQTPKFAIVNGYVESVIATMAEKNSVDLIIMGSKGETNLETRLFGSNAERVIRNSKIPILTIPNRVERSTMCKIAFAHEECILPKSEFLIKFVKSHKQGLKRAEVVKVETGKSEPVPKRVSLGGNMIGVEVVKSDSVVKGIQNYLKENSVNILCVFHHHNSTFDYLFNRSVTKTIFSRVQMPMLIVPWRHK